MRAPIVIIGIGELASVFAHGFLRCGHPVYPITRSMDLQQENRKIPSPCLVMVMVPEDELHLILEQTPQTWRDKMGLVQNELLPVDWKRHQLQNPTVAVVWFEKKKGKPLNNILYTPVYGPNATIIANALKTQDIPAPILENEYELLYELASKALYILTVNIAGLVNNCTVSELWYQQQSLAKEIANEAITILEWRVGQSLPREKLIAGMVEGINDCPDRFCLGRRARERLRRALNFVQEAGIDTPKLKEIYRETH